MIGVLKLLPVIKIDWMGFKFKVWCSKDGELTSKRFWHVDLIHPLFSFNTIPCLTFQKLFIEHLRKRRLKCDPDIFDWQEGYEER